MTDLEFAVWKYDAENSMAHLHFEINQLSNKLTVLTAAVKRIDDFAPFDPACRIPAGFWSAINALSDTLRDIAE